MATGLLAQLPCYVAEVRISIIRTPVKFGEDVFEAAYSIDTDFTLQHLFSFLMTLVNGEQ